MVHVQMFGTRLQWNRETQHDRMNRYSILKDDRKSSEKLNVDIMIFLEKQRSLAAAANFIEKNNFSSMQRFRMVHTLTFLEGSKKMQQNDFHSDFPKFPRTCWKGERKPRITIPSEQNLNEKNINLSFQRSACVCLSAGFISCYIIKISF